MHKIKHLQSLGLVRQKVLKILIQIRILRLIFDRHDDFCCSLTVYQCCIHIYIYTYIHIHIYTYTHIHILCHHWHLLNKWETETKQNISPHFSKVSKCAATFWNCLLIWQFIMHSLQIEKCFNQFGSRAQTDHWLPSTSRWAICPRHLIKGSMQQIRYWSVGQICQISCQWLVLQIF